MKLRRVRSPRTARVPIGVGILVLLASCTATPQSTGGWFGSAAPTPEPTKAPSTASQVRRTYYAGVEGLKVYSEPSTSSRVVGTLSLHEKVVRTNLERGYAFVESTKSELKGWVDNAQLAWRLPAGPSTAAPTTVEAEPEGPEAPAPEEPSPTPTTALHPTPTAAVFPTMMPAPTAAPRELPTPRPVNPSIFNPY